MNFIEILIAFLTGWITALIAIIEGYAIVKPYLDRRLLLPPVPKTQKLPDSITI